MHAGVVFFLNFGHVFYVFNVLFLFFKRFFILKNVGKVQSGKQINYNVRDHE